MVVGPLAEGSATDCPVHARRRAASPTLSLGPLAGGREWEVESGLSSTGLTGCCVWCHCLRYRVTLLKAWLSLFAALCSFDD